MRTVYFLLAALLLVCCVHTAAAQTHSELRAKAQEQAEAYDFEAALETTNQAMALASKEPGKKSLDYGLLLAEAGAYRVFLYDAELGMSQLNEGLEIAKKAAGASNADYLEVYGNLGAIHFFNEDYQAALEVFQTTTSGLKSAKGANSTTYGEHLSSLGMSQLYLGQYADAQASFNEHLAILDHNKLLNTGEHASLLSNIATVYQDSGNQPKAEKAFREALKIGRKAYGLKHIEYANCLNNLGILYTEMGRHDDALELFFESRDVYEAVFTKQSLDYARALNNIANVAGLTGDYKASERNYLEAQAIKEALIGDTHGSYIRGLNNLGTAYLNWGRTSDALAYLERCLELIRPKKDESPLDYAEYATNLAGCYRQLGRYADSERLYLEVKAIYVSFVGERHPVIAYVLTALGTLRVEESKFKEGQKLFQEAIDIYKEYEQTESLDYLETVHMLGMSYLNMKAYKDAEQWINKAVSLSKKLLGPAHPHPTQFMVNEGYLYEKMGNTAKAEKAYLAALDSYTNILDEQLTFMSAEEKARYWSDIRIGYAFFNNFAVRNWRQNPQLLDHMYRYRLATKSMVLNSTLKVRSRIMASDDEALKTAFRGWKSNKEYLNKLYSLPSSELLAGSINVDSLEQVTTQMEKLLTEQSEVFAGQFAQETISWKNIQAALEPNEAAVELIRAPAYGQDKDDFDITYCALVVRPGLEQPMVVTMENGRQLDNDFFNEYFYHIFEKKEDPHSYEAFWEPIAAAIQGAQRVYLSTDGVYNVMNVNTLMNPNTGQFVVDEVEVRLVANTADVVKRKREQPKPAGPQTAMLLGYPNYYLDLTKELENYKAENEPLLALAEAQTRAANKSEFNREFLLLADLPGTKTEVEAIETILKGSDWDVTTLMENAAIEQRVKALKSPKLLHLSTHGFFEFGKEKQAASTLGLARDVVVRNPLLRSGIMLAGSGFSLEMVQGDLELLTTMEDGILTGYEATALDLDNTELVVLSACLTRVGNTKLNDSEGYFGMLRSFLMAGAKSVVASSWAVDDKATQELMIRFYKHWAAGLSKTEAFRTAQRELKKEMPEPYYWGAFIMVGQ